MNNNNNSPFRNFNSPVRSPAASPSVFNNNNNKRMVSPLLQGNQQQQQAAAVAEQKHQQPQLQQQRRQASNSPVFAGRAAVGGGGGGGGILAAAPSSRPVSPISNQLNAGGGGNNNNNNNKKKQQPSTTTTSISRQSMINSHYFPKKELGRGSFGVVHLCRVTSSGMVRLMTNFASFAPTNGGNNNNSNVILSPSNNINNNNKNNNNNVSFIPHEVVVKSVRLSHLEQKMKDLSIQEVAALMKLRHNSKIVKVLDAWIETSSSSSSLPSSSPLLFGGGRNHNHQSPLSSPSPSSAYADNPLCIALEYCQGGTLEEYIRNVTRGKPGNCSPATAVSIATQLFQGIEFIHQNKLLHRDVKPANVMFRSKINTNNTNTSSSSSAIFSSKGGLLSFNSSSASSASSSTTKTVLNSIINNMDLVLCDLGIARTLDHTVAMACTRIGTPIYLSPEATQGMKYSYPSDVWSVGVILYEIVAGMRPFTAHGSDHPGALMMRIINQDPIPNMLEKCCASSSSSALSQNNNESSAFFYPIEFLNLIKSCLNKDQYRRPTSSQALEMLHDIVAKYNLATCPHQLQQHQRCGSAASVSGGGERSSSASSSSLSNQQQQARSNSVNKQVSLHQRRSPSPQVGYLQQQPQQNQPRSGSVQNNKLSPSSVASSSSPYQPPAPQSSPINLNNNQQQYPPPPPQQPPQQIVVGADNNNNNNNVGDPTTLSSLLSSCRTFVQSKIDQQQHRSLTNVGAKLQQKIGFAGCLALAMHYLVAVQLATSSSSSNNNINNNNNKRDVTSSSSTSSFKFTPIRVRAALSMLSCSDDEARAYLQQASLEQIGIVCEMANEVFLK